ncbi:hypothetical protein [Streptomyces sp. NPDC052036]|uniref:hypothetical protein n=1 Tax=Streptomyces sp. NPDC052036 TaxID=3155171 RepID=UPI003427B724
MTSGGTGSGRGLGFVHRPDQDVKGSEPDLTYAVGGHWLVPARKGAVLACSVVGADPAMRRLFQRAFAPAVTPPHRVPVTPPGA